ncbi:MAG: transcription antitermination factor NusB [Candidatus Babeliaceae bacterium]|nr:transcription antitermination factor NusB [Candidatus Babeliaceae bacterium]
MDNNHSGAVIDQQSCDTLSARDQRALILHLLYAADSFDYQVSLDAIVDNFSRGFDCIIEPQSALVTQAQAIIDAHAQLDEQIKPLLDNWKLERVGCMTRIILRMSVWELEHTQIDHSIIINEAIELAKGYAESDAHKFINGVLDKWVKENKPALSIINNP